MVDFTNRVVKVLLLSHELASRHGYKNVEPEHVLLACLRMDHSDVLKRALSVADIDPRYFEGLLTGVISSGVDPSQVVSRKKASGKLSARTERAGKRCLEMAKKSESIDFDSIAFGFLAFLLDDPTMVVRN